MKRPPLIIAPSIIAADFGRFAHEAGRTGSAGADWIHCDVMDGHFVPNITFGPDSIRALRAATALPLDVHLMISRPDRYAARFIEAGADHVIVHVEAEHDVAATLSAIRGCGKRAGLALNPATPAQRVFRFLEAVDELLVMTVNPGFGGQAFMADVLPKITACRQQADNRGLSGLDIVVDGGIDTETGRRCVAAGANVLVAGTSLFRHPKLDLPDAIRELRQHAARAD
jgi:ribulose-phosphate 3-epimerase